MAKKRITATSSLLTVLKRGGLIQPALNSEYFIRQKTWEWLIIAHSPLKSHTEPMTRAGLQRALDWLYAEMGL